MKRLFTFGCSFTRYRWPTWADILALDYDRHHNWAKGGGGNHFIFYSLIECARRNQITADDHVIIMWTSAAREDRYINGWKLQGSVYHCDLPSDYVAQFTDTTGYYFTSVLLIDAARRLLDSIGCEYHFLSMVPMGMVDDAGESLFFEPDTTDAGIAELFGDTLILVRPSVYELVFDCDWSSRDRVRIRCIEQEHRAYIIEQYKIRFQSGWPAFNDYETGDKQVDPDLDWRRDQLRCGARLDSHPTPREHLEYLEKLGTFTIQQHHRDFVDYWQEQVCDSDGMNWVTDVPERF